MDKKDIYIIIDEILDLDPGTINGSEKIDDLEDWDSLAVISLIAMADEKFGISLSPSKIREAVTTSELADGFVEVVV